MAGNDSAGRTTYRSPFHRLRLTRWASSNWRIFSASGIAASRMWVEFTCDVVSFDDAGAAKPTG